nr:diacylglycerol kinase [Neptunicella marina]
MVLASNNSFRAFNWLMKNEAAFRQECILLLLGTTILFFWDISLYEKTALFISLLLIILAEIINTAIEAVVDRISLDIHPLSGLAKDLGSAAVLISLGIAAIIWTSVLVSYFSH